MKSIAGGKGVRESGGGREGGGRRQGEEGGKGGKRSKGCEEEEGEKECSLTSPRAPLPRLNLKGIKQRKALSSDPQYSLLLCY